MPPLLSKEEIAELLSPLGSDSSDGSDGSDGTGEDVQPPETELIREVKITADGRKNNRIEPVTAVPVQLRVEAGRCRLPIDELLALKKGSLLTLDSEIGSSLALYANDVLIGRGSIVRIGNKTGIKITETALTTDLVKRNKGNL